MSYGSAACCAGGGCPYGSQAGGAGGPGAYCAAEDDPACWENTVGGDCGGPPLGSLPEL